MANPFDIIPQILSRWGAKQKSRLKRAFAVGGHQAHGGKRWVPLSPSTGTRLPLVKTGALMNSMFFKASGVSVVLGSNSTYAIYHQNGTKSIPKREVVVITKRDIAELSVELKKAVEQQMRIR